MNKARRWMAILFIIYLLYLIWAIMFKFSFSYADIPSKRQAVNLRLFFNPGDYFAPVIIREKILNILIFIPFGTYLYMLGSRKMITNVCLILLTSILFEVIQYAFALGTSDIADVMTNTVGGLAGLVLALITLKISKKEEKMTIHFAMFAAILSVVIIGGTLFLKLS